MTVVEINGNRNQVEERGSGVPVLLAEIIAPALFVSCALDVVSTPALSHGFARRTANARVVEIADCAHHIEWEKPGVLLDAIGRFLRERR